MSDKLKPLAKCDIDPVRVVLTVDATRINENGTFCGFNVVDVQSDAAGAFASVGYGKNLGAIWLKVPINKDGTPPDGIELRPSGTTAAKAKAPIHKLKF